MLPLPLDHSSSYTHLPNKCPPQSSCWQGPGCASPEQFHPQSACFSISLHTQQVITAMIWNTYAHITPKSRFPASTTIHSDLESDRHLRSNTFRKDLVLSIPTFTTLGKKLNKLFCSLQHVGFGTTINLPTQLCEPVALQVQVLCGSQELPNNRSVWGQIFSRSFNQNNIS